MASVREAMETKLNPTDRAAMLSKQPSFPIRSVGLRGYWARRDVCPVCGGELDTGKECNDCAYDAGPDAWPR